MCIGGPCPMSGSRSAFVSERQCSQQAGRLHLDQRIRNKPIAGRFLINFVRFTDRVRKIISLAERRAQEFAASIAILRANREVLDELLPVLMERGEMDDAALAPWAARIVPLSALSTAVPSKGPATTR